MSDLPADLKYTEKHEWVRLEGNLAVIGITDHAQHELGDIVYVELPKVGSSVSSMKQFGTIESVKAASELYSPVSGKVVAINGALDGAPETINKSAYQDGWMIKVEISSKDELRQLLDPAAYQKLITK